MKTVHVLLFLIIHTSCSYRTSMPHSENLTFHADKRNEIKNNSIEFQEGTYFGINAECLTNKETENLLFANEAEEKDKKKSSVLVWAAVGGCVLVVYLVSSLIIGTENR